MSNKAQTTASILGILIFLTVIPFTDDKTSQEPGLWSRLRMMSAVAVASDKDVDQPDIEWFKRQLRISPKYLERREGVLGLSWAHFLTMVFLIVSFVVALLAVFVRYKRTKELLTLILEEEKKSEPKS